MPKVGQKTFTMHSQIWSAFDGHHMPAGIAEFFDLKDPAAKQSLFTLAPCCRYISRRIKIVLTFDRGFEEEVIRYSWIYNYINQCFSEYFCIFNLSLLNIKLLFGLGLPPLCSLHWRCTILLMISWEIVCRLCSGVRMKALGAFASNKFVSAGFMLNCGALWFIIF